MLPMRRNGSAIVSTSSLLIAEPPGEARLDADELQGVLRHPNQVTRAANGKPSGSPSRSPRVPIS
jgi:hypothetical protein